MTTTSKANPLRALALLVVLALGAVAIHSRTAGAATNGQLPGEWGTQGTAPGQLFEASGFGVDSAENDSVFIVDRTADEEAVVVQKFSKAGLFEAASEPIPVPQVEEGGEKIRFLNLVHGPAIDSAQGLLYLLRVGPEGSNSHLDQKLIVLKTAASAGGKLTGPTGGAPAEYILPKAGEPGAIVEGGQIAVDPSTGDPVLLGVDETAHTVLQPVTSTGTLLTPRKFPVGIAELSFTFGPDGTAYRITGGFETKLERLPPGATTWEALPRFAEALKEEGGGEIRTLTVEKERLEAGSNLSVTPEDDGIYFTGYKGFSGGSETEPGEYEVREYSFATGGLKHIYGLGGGTCRIQSLYTSIASIENDHLLVFNPGNGPFVQSPSFGVKVSEFGPGGSGCPLEPAASVLPVVSGLTPNHGPAAGGNQVVIAGEQLGGATAVAFGSKSISTGFTVNPAGTQVTVTAAPAGTGGATVPVTVTTPNGTSATVAADQYTYDRPQSSPVVGDDAVGARTTSTAVLNAHVNNEGDAAGSACGFQVTLATDSAFAHPLATLGCSPARVFGTASTAVSATAGGLSPSTSYLYRVVATNAGGSSTGSPISFATAAAPAQSGPAPVTVKPPTPGTGGKPTVKPTPKQTAKQKALAKCKKLKGKAKRVCVKKADQIGKKPKKHPKVKKHPKADKHPKAKKG